MTGAMHPVFKALGNPTRRGADLVTTQDCGREKLDFLNPVPIRLISD